MPSVSGGGGDDDDVVAACVLCELSVIVLRNTIPLLITLCYDVKSAYTYDTVECQHKKMQNEK